MFAGGVAVEVLLLFFFDHFVVLKLALFLLFLPLLH